jgi:type IV pilus assembly protein PilE
MKNNLLKPVTNEAGFTLIELMIAIAVIAIIAGLALPSYIENVARGRRADAQGVVLEAASWMESYFNQNNNSYVVPAATFSATGLATSPRRAANGTQFYNIAVTNPGGDPMKFTITATAVNRMSSDRCATFTLTHLGVRGGTANCWAK